MTPYEQALADAKTMVEEFRRCLPESVQANQFTLESKNPFKAMVLREGLIHRITWLAQGAVSEFNAERWIPATVLVRAVAEPIAVLHCLLKKTLAALEKRDDASLSEFLGRVMVGFRNDPARAKMINVLTMIDAVDKDFPKFRQSYDALSEYAHPNWCGVLGAFSTLDPKNFVTRFEPVNALHNAASLAIYLLVAKEVYNKAGHRIAELSAAFDRGDLKYVASTKGDTRA